MSMNKYKLTKCCFFIYIKRPLSSRSYRSSSIVTDGVVSTPSTRMSVSSNQEIPIIDRFVCS
jgi:hypothetical protein